MKIIFDEQDIHVIRTWCNEDGLNDQSPGAFVKYMDSMIMGTETGSIRSEYEYWRDEIRFRAELEALVGGKNGSRI